MPVTYGRIQTAWQAADNESLDPALKFIAGRSKIEAQLKRLWAERPRGAAKTTDIGVMVLYLIFASTRPISGVGVAADLDQARLLLATIGRIVALNPWLERVIDLQRDRVSNRHNGAEFVVISSDAGSSYGLTPDIVICDEISHWPEGRGQAMWDSLASSAAKKKNCLFVCITNAGWKGSFVWPLREAIRLDPSWRFSRLESPPEFIDEDRLAEQRRLLPDDAYRRLWKNEWISGDGNSLNLASLAECVTRPGPLKYRPNTCDLIGSVDIGLRRDRAAFTIFYVDAGRGKLVLAHEQSWNPKDFGGEIPLYLIKDAITAARARVQLTNVVLDPWNAASLCQDLRGAGFNAFFRETSAKALSTEATTLLEVIESRTLELFPGQTYRDLEKVRVVTRPTGYKLEWPRDRDGHCDCGASLTQMLPEALAFMRRSAPGNEQYSLGYVQDVSTGRFSSV